MPETEMDPNCGATSAPPESGSLVETLSRIRSDYVRITGLMGARSLMRKLFWIFYPSVVALTIYRLSHYFYGKGLRFLAWPLYLANVYLTGVDITPSTVIGRSCFLGHARGTIISGHLGDGVILFGQPGIGGGLGAGDAGGAPGLPVIGNNVVVGIRAVVLGPVRIGDNVTIGACALVMKDIGEGQVAIAPQARVLPRLGPRIDYEALAGLKQPTGN